MTGCVPAPSTDVRSSRCSTALDEVEPAEVGELRRVGVHDPRASTVEGHPGRHQRMSRAGCSDAKRQGDDGIGTGTQPQRTAQGRGTTAPTAEANTGWLHE